MRPFLVCLILGLVLAPGMPGDRPAPAREPWRQPGFNLWAFEVTIAGDGLLPVGAPAGREPPVCLAARGTVYRVRADGLRERSPHAEDKVLIVIPDLHAAARQRPDVAAIVPLLHAVIEDYGRDTGQF